MNTSHTDDADAPPCTLVMPTGYVTSNGRCLGESFREYGSSPGGFEDVELDPF
jgi:hypothetical protein